MIPRCASVSGRLPAIGVGVPGQGVERRPETMLKAAYHTASGHRAAMARCSPAWSSAMTHATPRPVRPVRTRVPLARDARGRIELVRADRRIGPQSTAADRLAWCSTPPTTPYSYFNQPLRARLSRQPRRNRGLPHPLQRPLLPVVDQRPEAPAGVCPCGRRGEH